MASLTLHNPQGENSGLKAPIVYTAMHGVSQGDDISRQASCSQVGWPYCRAAWEAAGFPPSLIVPVPEQKDPHPDFPTGFDACQSFVETTVKDNVSVEYPNPEEGASSLDLAFRTAEASGAR